MALTAAASSWAGIGQWTSLGGPEGGNITMLAIDPNTAETIYAARNDGSTFKSIDGGARWTVTDFPVGRLIIDPEDSQTLYVATPRLGFFKSSDGGATWRDANSGLTGYGSSLEFDPQNPKTLYTGVGRRIFKSADGAESWAAFSSLPPDTREYTVSLAIDPQDPKTLYAAQSGFLEADSPGFYRSSDGGANWTRIPAADNLMSYGTLRIDPKSPNTLYAVACSGFTTDDCDYWTIFKSMDRGDSWQVADSGLPHDLIHLVAMDPQNPAALYAVSPGEGLFRTMDGGASWNKVITELVAYNVSNLTIDPQNAGTLYAGTSSGVRKSVDGGVNWVPANAGLIATSISMLGIGAANIGTANQGTLYAVNNDWLSSLFESTDAGASWTSLSPGLPKRSDVWKLIADPSDSGVLYAIVRTFPTSDATLFKSTDGGASWNSANSGLPGFNNDVALDPSNQGTLYASSYGPGQIGLGIYTTTDAGISWSYVGPGPMFGNLPRPASLTVDPQHPKTIYSFYFGQVWKSMDGGATFAAINAGLPMSAPFPIGNIRTFAIAPQDSSILYAWTEACHQAMPGFFTCTNAGLFKSTNGGAGWKQASPALADGGDGIALVIDPRNSSTMYTLSDRGDVFQSMDGGANWTSLSSGQTTQRFTTLAMDSRNPSTLYAGTEGGGVFAITLID